MAQGPMSVGAQESIKFITDKTLTQEDIAADAKVVGEKLAKKFDAAGGTLAGDLSFPPIGDTDVSKKLIWSGSTDGAEIYYQTIGPDHGRLVINLKDDDNCELVIAQNGAARSYFTPADGKFHGDLQGTASYATKAGNADKVNGIHFEHKISTDAVDLLTYTSFMIETGEDPNPSGRVGFRRLNNIYAHLIAASDRTDANVNWSNVGIGGKGYVRFQNGIQVCWGEGTTSGYITFPLPFLDTMYTVMVTPLRDVLHDYFVKGKNASGFTMDQKGSSSTATTTYFAYGWWKKPSDLGW